MLIRVELLRDKIIKINFQNLVAKELIDQSKIN